MAWTELGNGKIKSAALDGSELFDYEVTAIAPTGIVIEPSPVSDISETATNQISDKFALNQNYPNPFSSTGGSAFGRNPITHINYALPENTWVTIALYDLLGRKLNVLVDEKKLAGYHVFRFDAGNLPSGVYIYKIITENGFHASRKLVLIK